MVQKNLELTELIADTLASNDFEVITHVPGFGGTQVYEQLKNKMSDVLSICLNEEAAFSIATGASLYGSRSVTLIKTHGLAKMANALCSTLSVGTNAANLVIAFHDSTGKSSDNVFDALGLIKGLDAPFVILTDKPEAELIRAIELSEKIKLPVVIYVDCENLKVIYEYEGLVSKNEVLPFTKNPLQYVACPPLSSFQREIFVNKVTKQTLPHEYVAPAIIKNIPDGLPPHLKKIFDSYAPIFNVFSELNVDFVSGDAGTSSLYAFHEKKFIDACTYMGGAPGMALGAHLAGAKNAWAITGDFSFMAAGILGLNEIMSRNLPVRLLVFKNGIAGATGGQELPQRVMEIFIAGHKQYISHLNAKMDADEIESILLKMNDADMPQIGIVEV